MSEQYYKATVINDSNYEEVNGPEGFSCLITEPEDRYFFRDLKPLLKELNRLYERNEMLEANIQAQNEFINKFPATEELLKATLMRVRDWIKFQANSDRGIVAEIDDVFRRAKENERQSS